MPDASKRLYSQRYEHPRMIQFRAVLEFLRRLNAHAPQVQDDLLKSAARLKSISERRLVVADWASRWNLCAEEGPVSWALQIGLDTMTEVPEYGWNLAHYAASPVDSPLPVGYMDYAGTAINIPALTITWHEDKESAAAVERRIIHAVLREVRPQITETAEERERLFAPLRRTNRDRIFTFLIRFQILGEAYGGIVQNPQKYREEPDSRTRYRLSDIMRDVALATTRLRP